MTVSIVANGFLRNSPIFPLQKPAESSTIRPSACCTLNPAYQRNARDRTFTQSRMAQSPKGAIQHVIYVQFDNTHFRRDNPDVSSDLEQMPHLLNFIQDNGVLMSNDHTVLISHTATGILTSLTGVYPDRMGQPVSNSFRYFKTDGTTRTGVSFAYWTAPLFDPAGSTTDTTPEMINENAKIAPAPWVPFTRAGCDFGGVATANTILENTAIDIPTVFGLGSPEAAEVMSNPGQAFADFVGIGVHCAQTARPATCSNCKPTIRHSRNSSTGLRWMELTRATRCSCSLLTKAITSSAMRRPLRVATG